MFSVPGRYSGGEGTGYAWTQTLNEIELRAPVPESVAQGSVRCTYGARQLDASWGQDNPSISGELSETVVVDDCLWVVEREGNTSAMLVVTLRKAVPRTWRKLFTADAEPEEAPQLLDAPKPVGMSEEQKSKQTMLKEAKARAATELQGPSKAQLHTLAGKMQETVVVSAADLPTVALLVVTGCKGCKITLPADANVIKVQIERCEGCTINLHGRVITQLVELWECTATSVNFSTACATVQVDKCSGLDFAFSKLEYFERLMHAGGKKMKLSFADAPELASAVDFDELQKERNHVVLSEETDQFITRRLGKESELSTEMVIRLCNDFPTTEREAREFEERTRMQSEKLDEVVDSMLGSSLGRTLTAAEQKQMKNMLRDEQTAATAAQEQAELTSEGRAAARVDFKKKLGNEAFKAADYQQAAVLYTEAITLDAKQHALFSNRAACFLKIGRYEQALSDAESCIALAPDFGKGHFRRALALQALSRYPDACGSFTKVIELEPKNKEAASGLNMARMQAERQRRQEAGMTTN